jgi:hypothetical protein
MLEFSGNGIARRGLVSYGFEVEFTPNRDWTTGAAVTTCR